MLRRVAIPITAVIAFSAGWFASEWTPSPGARNEISEPGSQSFDKPAVPQPGAPLEQPPKLTQEPSSSPPVKGPGSEVTRELKVLREELSRLKEKMARQDEVRERRQQRRDAMANATDDDFASEALMETIGEVMDEAGLKHEIVAMDCAKAPCIFFGTFDFNDPVMMDAWVRFREPMYDRGRPFFSTQFRVSENRAVFALAPSRDQHDPYELMRRADPILKELTKEARPK